MTQGGKIHDSVSNGPVSAFAPLRQWLSYDSREIEPAVKNLAAALADFDGEGKLSIEILEDEGSQHWVVGLGRGKAAAERGLGRGKAAAERGRKAKADVRLVMRRDTWIDIAQGRLNPFDAFAGGKLLVGGDTELAKRVVRHLTDPLVAFVSPC